MSKKNLEPPAIAASAGPACSPFGCVLNSFAEPVVANEFIAIEQKPRQKTAIEEKRLRWIREHWPSMTIDEEARVLMGLDEPWDVSE